MDMTVFLDDELAHFVDGQVAAGRFRSSSDLVSEALRLLKAIETGGDDGAGWLREAWRDGVDSGDAGEIDIAALKAEARGRRTASAS